MSGALWLESLAEKGGKGTVDNIDARALGRIAVEIKQLQFELRMEREALVKAHNKARRVAQAVVQSAVVKRSLPETFWPNVKERQQIWDVAYGYGILDCLGAITPTIEEKE